MKIDIARTPVGVGYVIALVGAVLIAGLMAAALVLKATKKPTVLLVTESDGPRVITAGQVPDTLARDYARDFVMTFENYHPATLAANLAFLETRFLTDKERKGRALFQFRRYGEKLAEVVLISKQVSQLVLTDPQETKVERRERSIEVTLRGIKRIYVKTSTGSRTLDEADMIYQLELVAVEPTRENPTGLLVKGFHSRLADSKPKNRKEHDESKHSR